MQLLKDRDTSLQPLAGKTVAVLGYGNQGRGQGLNLRDSGIRVVVGNRDDEYRDRARTDGFEVMEISEASARGDILLVLTTDESQPEIWHDQIAPGISAGNTLVWASGYNIGYDLIRPPADVDVLMVAPRMTGVMVRTLFEHGKGAIAQFAVHQDASGNGRQTALALCKGMGLTRGGVFESSFREEAELDLFAEQVIWAGLTAWFVECFEMGVESGFSPELMVMELYASGEASEILGHMGTQRVLSPDGLSLHYESIRNPVASAGPHSRRDEEEGPGASEKGHQTGRLRAGMDPGAVAGIETPEGTPGEGAGPSHERGGTGGDSAGSGGS